MGATWGCNLCGKQTGMNQRSTYMDGICSNCRATAQQQYNPYQNAAMRRGIVEGDFIEGEVVPDTLLLEHNEQKPCAASLGGVHCQADRADGSLFCPRHRYVSNRLYLPTVSNDALAREMRRDGEPQ